MNESTEEQIQQLINFDPIAFKQGAYWHEDH